MPRFPKNIFCNVVTLIILFFVNPFIVGTQTEYDIFSLYHIQIPSLKIQILLDTSFDNP